MKPSQRNDNVRSPARATAARALRWLAFVSVPVLLLSLSAAGVHEEELYVVETTPSRGWFGIRFRHDRSLAADRPPPDAAPMGVQVLDVLGDTPAERSGIRAGDIIVSFQGRAVGADDLGKRILRTSAGTKITLEIDRDGAPVMLYPTLVDRSSAPGAPPGEPSTILGMRLSHAWGLSDTRRSVIVMSVHPVSPAARAGLKPGMIIACAQGEPLHHVDDLAEILKVSPSPAPVMLGIQRGRRLRLVAVTPDR